MDCFFNDTFSTALALQCP